MPRRSSFTGWIRPSVEKRAMFHLIQPLPGIRRDFQEVRERNRREKSARGAPAGSARLTKPAREGGKPETLRSGGFLLKWGDGTSSPEPYEQEPTLTH